MVRNDAFGLQNSPRAAKNQAVPLVYDDGAGRITSFHTHRTLGGYRHHRDSRCAAAAGLVERQVCSNERQVPKQLAADYPRHKSLHHHARSVPTMLWALVDASGTAAH